MECTRENYLEIKEYISKSLLNYIKFVNNNKSAYKFLWENTQEWNEKLKNCESIQEFEWKYNIDLKQATKDKVGLDYLPVAKEVLNHIDDIHLNMLHTFIYGDMTREYEYSNKVQDWLCHFQMFCIEDGIFVSLERQNELLKKYPHFDVSAKSLRTLKCLGDLGRELENAS